MLELNYQRTKFVMSAPKISLLPNDNGMEIAFVGVSNAGKSSLINALCMQNNLAKTSSTPGRTQLINLFSVAPLCNIVDLPGYGYAAVPEKLKIEWQKSLGTYLEKRELLGGIVLLMDSRHPLKPLDQQMLAWCSEFRVPCVIALTKTDKLTQSELMKTLRLVNEALIAFAVPHDEDDVPEAFEVIPVSSVKKRGLDKLKAVLNRWFDPITSRYEELGITDLSPLSKEDFTLGDELPQAEGSFLGEAIASPTTKGKTKKQRYSPTARRLGTSKPFQAEKKRNPKEKPGRRKNSPKSSSSANPNNKGRGNQRSKGRG